MCQAFQIVHINGVLTPLDAAQNNLFFLRIAYGNVHNDQLIRYGLAYGGVEAKPTSDQVVTAVRIAYGVRDHARALAKEMAERLGARVFDDIRSVSV